MAIILTGEDKRVELITKKIHDLKSVDDIIGQLEFLVKLYDQ